MHPSIETLIWHYVAGKPKDSIQMTGSIEFSERLEAERELFAKLDVQQLEVLAAESQALVDKAMMMVRANGLRSGAATCSRVVIGSYNVPPTPPRRPRLSRIERIIAHDPTASAANASGLVQTTLSKVTRRSMSGPETCVRAPGHSR